MPNRRTRALSWLAGGAIASLAGYGAYVGIAWLRYGKRHPPVAPAADEPLDRFMPLYEVAECHSIRVAAPGEVTFAAEVDCRLDKSALIRAIFKGRELMLGSEPGGQPASPGFLAQMKSLGWGQLAEIPGREVVMGGATKPWEANPVFRALPPEVFRQFSEPGYAKIIWTLRADPTGPDRSIARTETRVVTTDPASRARFRRYWALLSPGIILIRWAMLRQVKREAERRFREQSEVGHASALDSCHR